MHFAPDRQWEKEGDPENGVDGLFGGFGFVDFNSIVEMLNELFEQFNASHAVNKIAFGPRMGQEARNSLNSMS